MAQQSPTRSARKVRKSPRLRAPMRPVVVPDDGDKPPSPKMIFKNEVIRRVGFTYPTLWRWMREGTFPLSFDVGSRTAWAESEIDNWLANRPRSNLKNRTTRESEK
jgi:predicted DNA-binding transcriptional regulator AlpA